MKKILQRSLRFGVCERYSLSEGESLIDAAKDFSRRLSKVIRHPVELEILEDYDALLDRVNGNSLELAWMSPLSYFQALENGAQVLALCRRHGSLTYRSAILVHADNPLKNFDQFRKLRFAWADPRSAASHMLPKLALLQLGLESEDFLNERFFSSPIEAARAVATGDADVCACRIRDTTAIDVSVWRDIRKLVGGIARSLRVVLLSDPIPSDGLVMNSKVSAQLKASLSQGIMALNSLPPEESPVLHLFDSEWLELMEPRIASVLDDWSWDTFRQADLA